MTKQNNLGQLPDGNPLNILYRIYQIIIQPRRFFNTTGWSSDFWVPILILTLAFASLRAVQLPEYMKSLDDPKTKTLIAKRSKITEEEASRVIERMKKIGPTLSILESPIIVVASSATVAFLIYLIGRIIFKQAIPYMNVFSLTAWTGIIASIPIILHIPLHLLKPEWVLPTSPVYLLPKSWQEHYFARVLVSMDLFIIWQVALLCIGTSRLYRVSLNRSISVIGTLFVCFAVLNALFIR